MRKKTPTADTKTVSVQPEEIVQDDQLSSGPADTDPRQSVRRTLHRYCSIALTMAVCVGGLMMLCGLKSFGKGLILGSLFSVLNFILMATALPLRVGLGRKKTFFFSLGSVYVRYALLAVPLVLAFNYNLGSVSTVAVGLFMVQIAILGDQLWDRLCNPLKVSG